MSSQRGGAPVGYLAELGPVEARAVIYLRLWCESARARGEAWNDFSQQLGPEQGSVALDSLEQLCQLCKQHGRRPLMRHKVSCKCLGADESCFANFIAAASEGDRDDAMWFAMLMVRADMAPCLVGLAETLGLALKKMVRVSAPDITTCNKTLH